MYWKTERARVASLSRSRTPDDPDLVSARRNLKAILLENRIRALVGTSPFLTVDQLDNIARLLKPGAE
jgi:hypothetical protein